MDILDSLRAAPSAELYRLYLAIGKMLDDPRRILKVRQRLRLGMAVSYIGDNPLEPPSQGTLVELRHTRAVVQDSVSRRHWAVPYAAIVPDSTAPPNPRRTNATPARPTRRVLHWRRCRLHRQTLERACRHHRQAELQNCLDRGDRL